MTPNGVYTDITATEAETPAPSDPEDQKTDISGDFTVTTETADGYSISGNTVTIRKGGVYAFSGVLDGHIVINTSENDDAVEIELRNVSVTSSDAAPVFVKSASKVKISAPTGTYNEITDSRAARSSDEDADTVTAENAGAAIWSSTDLDLKGHGALVVTANRNNGIQSKDDLEVKNLVLKVTALNHALKGNDSVTVESGELTLISTGGSGIKTSNSKVSSKGNQKGTIAISGGTIAIFACCDGLAAAYNVEITGEPVISIATDAYSEYTGTKADTGAETEMYLVVPRSAYSNAYTYYAYFYNTETSEGVFSEAVYATTVSNGRTSYYGLKLTKKGGYDAVAFYRFRSGSTPSLTEYESASEGMAVHSSKNGYLASSFSNGAITGDWVTITTSGSEYSMKGIKADNDITIAGGTVTIRSTDDAVHANGGDALENGATGAGTVQINGGALTITTKDDGLHADTTLTINSGTVNILTSYEGVEAHEIVINDGTTYIYATDDGMNASTAGQRTAASITINGGFVRVQTPSGDTDAVDSNGTITMTGGYLLVLGGSGTGGMAGSVDADSTVTVTGGTLIALGGICQTPASGSVNAYAYSGTAFSAGTYTVTGSDGTDIATFTISSSHTSWWIASELLKTGTTYTLYKDGTEVTNWTQTAGTAGNAAGGG
ncbi:MAG: carbohydrate-binding domain-containing protein, partial [Lachnospiraceae bacterium]|nr:carbohydrate-binding domain-containing protein [Lachnospiraceae bacterium]